MSKVIISLPKIIEGFIDYHDIEYLDRDLKKINPELTASEIGLNVNTGYYAGLIHTGNYNNKENQTMANSYSPYMV